MTRTTRFFHQMASEGRKVTMIKEEARVKGMQLSHTQILILLTIRKLKDEYLDASPNKTVNNNY